MPTGSVATALNLAKKMRRGRVTGPLKGATDGRSDQVNVTVPRGSHVIPADIVSALGNGNSLRGHAILSKAFSKSGGKSRSPKRLSPVKIKGLAPFFSKKGEGVPLLRDGGVPIAASDGEFIISPDDVIDIGDGNAELGHKLLNEFITNTRQKNIERQRKIGTPR